MTRIALITTTINVPTVLTQWAKSGMISDDIIIVAGDQKSPHREIVDLLAAIERETGVVGIYSPPKMQDLWAISEKIGWNCIQRRNIALLEAMMYNPQYILTIDDDNAPTSGSQVTQLVDIMEHRITGYESAHSQAISTNTGWYNPGRQCLTDHLRPVVHRGFPLSQRFVAPLITHTKMAPVGVAAMLWTGEPDIDAVERIAVRPNVTRIGRPNFVLTPGTWAPFNTQATMVRGDLAPALFMWPHVGRYDDIWASYVYRKVADKRGYGAYYGHPAVHQDRNEHDLVKDLEQEIFGMRWNESIIRLIQDVNLDPDADVISDVTRIFADLVMLAHPLPDETKYALGAWIDDVEAING